MPFTSNKKIIIFQKQKDFGKGVQMRAFCELEIQALYYYFLHSFRKDRKNVYLLLFEI